MFIYVFCVFFFKQKTAYEMRISDWSSDVCSSDLLIVSAPDVAQQYRTGIDVIDWNIEKTLYLVGMQVHGHDAVNAHHLQHIGNHLGRNRNPCGTRAAVLTRIAEIWDGGGNFACRGTAQGIDHDHDLDRKSTRLNSSH